MGTCWVMLMGLSWPILWPGGLQDLVAPRCLSRQGRAWSPAFPRGLRRFFLLQTKYTKSPHTARGGIQGSACSLPSTSGSLSLAELSGCRGGREGENPELCHGAKPGLKWGWNSGMMPWVAQVGQGWVLGRSGFLGFTSANEPLRRSWSSSF